MPPTKKHQKVTRSELPNKEFEEVEKEPVKNGKNQNGIRTEPEGEPEGEPEREPVKEELSNKRFKEELSKKELSKEERSTVHGDILRMSV